MTNRFLSALVVLLVMLAMLVAGCWSRPPADTSGQEPGKGIPPIPASGTAQPLAPSSPSVTGGSSGDPLMPAVFVPAPIPDDLFQIQDPDERAKEYRDLSQQMIQDLEDDLKGQESLESQSPQGPSEAVQQREGP